MTLQVLAQALDLADDHDVISGNPARGKRRRMKEKRSRRPWLEPDMVVDLLEVAGEWEAELAGPERKRADQCWGRRELLTLLCLGGPRIGETLKASRGDFDLGGGSWRIPASKTEAGERTVELVVTLAEALRGHVAESPSRGRRITARGPIFPTSTGTPLQPGNVRRMLRELVKKVDERRAGEGKMLLPGKVTPHSLRVTFVSLSFLAGRDPAWVMGQVGHKDARLTLEVYTRTMQRKRVDRQLVWGLMRFADEPEEWPGIGPATGPITSGVPSARRGSLGAR
jgi:integrase